METGEAPQSCGGRMHVRIEVFSATLENTDLTSKKLGYKDFFGVLLLRSCNQNFAIFDSKVLEPPQVNPEGHLTLTCPKRSIPVKDEVLIFPWFVDMYTCSMEKSQHVLWKADVDDMDRVIGRTIHCFHGVDLHVNFAVYRDPVEAHLDVYFADLKCGQEEDALIQVHSTVSASNSYLPGSEAKSILFHKLSGECVSLTPGMFVPLTLSRRMTIIPHQSTLLVHVNLRVCMGHGVDMALMMRWSSILVQTMVKSSLFFPTVVSC